MEDFVFESAQDNFAVMWSYLTALSIFFLVLQVKKLVHKKRMRTLCDLGLPALSASLFSVSILTETPWICAVCDGVSSWEAAYRIELWKVFQILWAGLSQIFSKAFRNAICSTEKENFEFPTVESNKVNSLHIICHSDVFNINGMNNPV